MSKGGITLFPKQGESPWHFNFSNCETESRRQPSTRLVWSNPTICRDLYSVYGQPARLAKKTKEARKRCIQNPTYLLGVCPARSLLYRPNKSCRSRHLSVAN